MNGGVDECFQLNASPLERSFKSDSGQKKKKQHISVFVFLSSLLHISSEINLAKNFTNHLTTN